MAGVNLDLDLTFIIQLTIVILLMLVFKRWVFAPYLDTLDERNRKTDITREEAGALKEEWESLASRYEASLSDARKTALDTKRRLRMEGLDHKDQAVAAARSDANQTIEKAQAEISEQVAAERGRVGDQVDALASIVAEKVIGRQVSGDAK